MPFNYGCITTLLIFIKREAFSSSKAAAGFLMLLNHDNLKLSFSLSMPIYISLITIFQYTLPERKCTNVSDFFTFRIFRIWNTRRFAIETISFPAELCHISSCYSANFFLEVVRTVSPLRFISLVIVVWHTR